MIGTARNALADRIVDKLPRIQSPALVVRGSRDPIVTQAWAEEVTRLLPQGRLEVVPGATHTMTFKYPRELADVVLPFVLER